MTVKSTCKSLPTLKKSVTTPPTHNSLPFAANIWSNYPNIWSRDLNIWVHPCLKYIIWHCLTIYYPKILNIFGLLAFCWHICSILAIYLPYASNIWSHDPNIWAHTRQIYNSWHPLTKSFSKIYTLLGQNGTHPYICAWPELFSFPPPTAKFGSKLPDQNRSAPRQN